MARKTNGQAMRVESYPTVLLGLLLLVFGLTSRVAKGVSTCDTFDTISRLMPCLPAVNSNPAPPSSECCFVVKNTSYDCLCSCLQSPVAKGFDLGIALQLPRKCKRVVPPGTNCGAYNIPESTDDQ